MDWVSFDPKVKVVPLEVFQPAKVYPVLVGLLGATVTSSVSTYSGRLDAVKDAYRSTGDASAVASRAAPLSSAAVFPKSVKVDPEEVFHPLNVPFPDGVAGSIKRSSSESF